MNQVFNDVIWKDAKFHSFFYAEETILVPDEGLLDLSIDATLQNSEFRNVAYNRRLIGVAKQRFTVRDTAFANVTVFQNSPPCSDCTHHFIICNTGVETDFFTSTSDTYITVVNTCFQDVTSSNALLAAVTNDTTQVIINIDNNYVSGWTILEESVSGKDVCKDGIAISMEANSGYEECQTLSDASECPLNAFSAEGGTPTPTSGGRNMAAVSSSLAALTASVVGCIWLF